MPRLKNNAYFGAAMLILLNPSGIPIVTPTIPIKLCEFGGNAYGDELQTYQGECPGESIRPEGWYIAPKKFSEKQPKYRIERSERCGKSIETIINCSVNPDQRRCEDGSFPFFQTIFRVGGPDDGQLLSQRLRCPEDPSEETSSDLEIQEIRVTPEQFRRFPIKPSILNSDPRKYSLRNGHTHLWASTESQSFDTEINGTQVQVRATPFVWQWNYGDGVTRTFGYPGKPDAQHTLHHETPTSHSYTKTGIFDVNLTTLYRGEFRVSGGSWQAIPGQAAVPSEPISIDVWRTKKQLIAPDGE